MLSISRAVDQPPLSLGKLHGIPTPALRAGGFHWMSLGSNSDTPAAAKAYVSSSLASSPALPSIIAAGAGQERYSPVITISGTQTHHDQHRWPSSNTNDSKIGHNTSLPRYHDTYANIANDGPRQPEVNPLSRIDNHVHQLVNKNISPAESSPRTSLPATSSGNETQTQPPSPKSQRKAKSHVASACVPCKRAHLRCDAQRPCSRCVSNGKEDSCVDVQHKKRGRPRLRDDREARYDPSRFHQPTEGVVRHPVHIFAPSAPPATMYTERPRHFVGPEFPRGGAPNMAPSPKYVDQVLPTSRSDHLAYGNQAAVPSEPVAFMNLDLDFVKVSSTFTEALSLPQTLVGRRFSDILPAPEAGRAAAMRTEFVNEQKRREPGYLRPIYDRGEQAVYALQFTTEQVNRVSFTKHEYWPIISVNGQVKSQALKFGLLKEGLFFFIVVYLSLPVDRRVRSESDPTQHHAVLEQPRSNPVAPGRLDPYDLDRRRSSNESRSSYSASGIAPQGYPGSSPRISPPQTLYSASSSTRKTYNMHTPSQVPRSELPKSSHFPSFSPYQLPPIRPQPASRDSPSVETDEQRENKRRRVTIGGLIDSPETSSRRH